MLYTLALTTIYLPWLNQTADMPLTLVNTGTGPDSGDGDNLRDAFEKLNAALSTLDSEKALMATVTSLLATKANTVNVLALDQSNPYTPTGDYHPATKKFAEDLLDNYSVEWGDLSGDLNDQTDLANALAAKLSDAASDGNIWGRQDGGWVLVPSGTGPGNLPWKTASTDAGEYPLLTGSGLGPYEVPEGNFVPATARVFVAGQRVYQAGYTVVSSGTTGQFNLTADPGSAVVVIDYQHA